MAQQRKQRAMTIAEREQLTPALEQEWVMRPILLTLLFTGLRIGELPALQWEHIDFGNERELVLGCGEGSRSQISAHNGFCAAHIS